MSFYPLGALEGRFWRMLSVRWQREPLGSGSRLTGGRWNAKGSRALYLASDHSAAILEFHRAFVRPGTLATYEVKAGKIADLTDSLSLRRAAIGNEVLMCDWQTIFAIERRRPPSWDLAERLIAAGAQGALVPSAQHQGGVNFVLWRWTEKGDAEIRLIDPDGDLR
ncbi:RES domain-containing protein [Sphingosinicella sp. LHD-64]|uniref:RES family NAD+ phosphorylase n=1 Tax=Sphingosinicella sp. LHD-64 TaxID=3072139 RepID=UPI00280FA487|nr:RES domain-containing protein [Sphingosinicella sp. LHD-64]MDQ8756983.1 RES domain-containing protein [Sphingosinicella sp. LHD-64]